MFYKTPDETMHRLDFEYTLPWRKPEIVVINQEFLTLRRASRMNREASVVITKTRLAARLMHQFIPDVPCIRMPMYTPVPLPSMIKIHKEVNYAIHLAGHSCLKGTSAVAKAWRVDMPNLIVTCSSRLAIVHGINLLRSSPNIRIVWDLSTPSLHMALRRCEIAIIPSQCEGWSHAIREAMAHGCIVITCDAPPMNEFIQHMKNGILIPMDQAQPVPVYSVSMLCRKPLTQNISMLPPPQEIRKSVRMVMRLSLKKRQQIAQEAHNSWLRDTTSAIGKWDQFRKQLNSALGSS
jgi:hypothetical protein